MGLGASSPVAFPEERNPQKVFDATLARTSAVPAGEGDTLLDHRVKMFREFIRYSGMTAQECLDLLRKKVTDNMYVLRRIGSPSLFGETYLGELFPCPKPPLQPPPCKANPIA